MTSPWARRAVFLIAVSLCVSCATKQPDMQRCVAIEDADERLACFDELGSDAAAQAAEQDAEVDEDDFGLPEPTEPAELRRRTGTVVAASRDPYGKLTLTLDNGQVWKQKEMRSFDLPPIADGEPRVTIWKGRLGGYSLKLEGRSKAIQVKRLR